LDQKADEGHELFQGMLRWLDPNPEEAGHKYEEIRRRLIFVFRCRGFTFADDLADKCFDRVARIISRSGFTYEGDPALFFYGVAKLISKEHLRTKADPRMDVEGDLPEVKEHQSQCLQECMSRLSPRNAKLVADYYAQIDGCTIIHHRKRIADQLGIPLNALRIRMHRVRALLRRCVFECIESRSNETIDDISAFRSRNSNRGVR
jgi:DNA-directed RNA polymerase specialized sigma24 family protein